MIVGFYGILVYERSIGASSNGPMRFGDLYMTGKIVIVKLFAHPEPELIIYAATTLRNLRFLCCC